MTYQGDPPGQEATPRKPIYKDLLLLQLAALVFLSDQFSKFLVREFLAFREAYPAEGFFRITHSHNTGSAFGMFQDQNGPLILVALVGMTVLAFIYHSQRSPTSLLRLSLGLQMGGAAGNLLDRVLLGHVIDFIDVGTWPIFNLADSSIVVGLVLLGWLFLRPERFGGVKRSTAGHGSPEPPVVAEQPAAAWGTGLTPMGRPEASQTSSVPQSEAASSADLATGQTPEVDAEGTASPYQQEVPGDSGAGCSI